MSEPAPVPADQEEALREKIREAWAAAERIALKTAREKLEIKACAEVALAECATLRAERDQLASELREAREALHWAASEFDSIANNADPYDDAVGTQDHGLLLQLERQAGQAGEKVRALSDPRPSPAKGDDDVR